MKKDTTEDEEGVEVEAEVEVEAKVVNGAETARESAEIAVEKKGDTEVLSIIVVEP